jgi:hypothetical protein
LTATTKSLSPQSATVSGSAQRRRPAFAQRLAVKLAFPLVYAAIAALVVWLFVSILRINSGTFLYTMDDPYIHLALSDQIRHGNYGLFPGIHAAPSSSILFPFLLAPASGTPFHPWLPLVINVCAMFLTVGIMHRFLRHLRLGESGFAIAAQAGALFMAAVCFNIVGVVFTGLEHSLHIAAVAATVYGLALFLDRGKLPPWLPAVLVLSPLLRYEGLALSAGVLLVLAMKGRVRTALATFAVIVTLMGAFSVFLVRLGLPMLPSSILSKSAVAAGSIEGLGSFRAGFVQAVDTALGHPIGLFLMLIAAVAALACALQISHHGLFRRDRGWNSNGSMWLALLFLLTGQTAAGRWGWLERYEVYAIVGTAMIGVYLGRAAIRTALAPAAGPASRDRYIFAAGAALALFVFGTRYLFTTSHLPVAANNIYEQQLQMHNFIDDFYRAPVAVNDIGLASYRSPYFALDLGGLGSEKARKLQAEGADADAYKNFVAENGIHLIIVYEEWFSDSIPDTWQKVGTMSLSRFNWTSAHPDVQFYVTDDATAATVRRELTAFRAVLPPRVKLVIY